MKRRFFLAICFSLFSLLYTSVISAQEKVSELDYIEMDIRTASLMELAAWCRELGLAEGGSREELALRLLRHYEIDPAGTALAEQRIITIESAKTTEYFTLETVDEEYARLKGDVIVSLKDGNAVHRIKAMEILYNRTRNVMTATGNVEYIKEEGDSRESFKGESITVNLDNWSSIFMDGASEKSKAGTGSAYRFAGTIISRNDEKVTVLTNAEITNAGNEESYWSLNASKLWLLPGNDWAILNAVLKIGNIPVLYLPAFYYPADEIVFHPVLGVRTREGTFLQTTTYILGQPKAGSMAENSLTRIFGGASDEAGRKREGVFIRRTDEKTTNVSDTTFKLMLDAYTNMGFYLGTELGLPRKGVLGETKFEAGVGFTRDVYDSGSWHTPLYNGESYWNTDSDFFGLASALRFRIKTNGSIRHQYGSFQWDLPYYSDPYVDRDFTRRSELLDWFAMLRDGVTSDEENEVIDPLANYEWRLNGSINPQVKFLSPYISTLSIPAISHSLSFISKDSNRYKALPTAQQPSTHNPGKSFFYPNQLNIATISTSISGTPLTVGARTSTQTDTGTAEAPGDKLLPAVPLSPWDKGTGKTAETSDGTLLNDNMFSIPELAQKFDLGKRGGARFVIDYRLSPSAASELKFDSLRWTEQKDYIDFSSPGSPVKHEGIDWSEYSSILTSLGGTGNIGFGLNHTEGAYSASLGFSGNASWKQYYLNEDATDYVNITPAGNRDPDWLKRKTAHDQAGRETYFSSSWNLAGSVKPFFRNIVFSDTSVDYALQGLLAKNTADSVLRSGIAWNERSWTRGNWDRPFWDWDKDNIQSHQVTTNINANLLDYKQTFSVSTVLPPLDSSITANAIVRAWISETSVRSQIQNIWSWETGDPILRPISITETLSFSTWGSFRGYLEIDTDPNSNKDGMDKFTRATLDLNLWGFTAAFTASYAKPYSYNSDFLTNGRPMWELGTNDVFEPRELNFRYSKKLEKSNLWGNRLSFSINANTNLMFDLQRYTNSKMSFSLDLNINISNFLRIQFSARSENNVIYRYKFFRYMLFFIDHPDGLYPNQEDSFFKDLAKSFNFFSDGDREATGFKLKELNVSLVHFLGDWKAELSVSLKPHVNLTTHKYEFRNEISFFVQWFPIEEMRTEISYKEEKLTIK